MTGEDSRAKEIMSYTFIEVFADDGTIDADELEFIKRLALKDGVVDDEERVVLANIFSRVGPDIVAPEVWEEIHQFCADYDIPAP